MTCHYFEGGSYIKQWKNPSLKAHAFSGGRNFCRLNPVTIFLKDEVDFIQWMTKHCSTVSKINVYPRWYGRYNNYPIMMFQISHLNTPEHWYLQQIQVWVKKTLSASGDVIWSWVEDPWYDSSNTQMFRGSGESRSVIVSQVHRSRGATL